MLKIGVLVSGGGTNLQAIMDAIDTQGIPAEIVSVVSSNPNAYALERAKNKGIEAVTMRKRDYADAKAYDIALAEHFKSRGVGLVVLAGFMTILGETFVNEFENKIMNIHPALIPSFCGDGFYGLHVHEAVLAKGVKLTGATVHFVSPITDGGPIILQKAVEVLDDDTPEVLQKRVMEQAEWKIFPEAIRLFAEGKLQVEGNKVRIKK
ncbi:MAG: phosphoribosylglycinamide formyltransferase [Firmicutes bacterium]|nr:phosphoribosylglycinamide formyltransferase [Bacillota bacterium]